MDSGWTHVSSFTESETSAQARRWIEQDDLADALTYLAQVNAIRPRQAPQASPKGGRPPRRPTT